MLKPEEVKEMFTPILESLLDGNIHETTEEVIKKIIDDYSSNGITEESGNEWEEKYNELKRKYVSRFMGDEEKEETKEEIIEEKKEDKKDDKKVEETKLEDIYEEKKEEKDA